MNTSNEHLQPFFCKSVEVGLGICNKQCNECDPNFQFEMEIYPSQPIVVDKEIELQDGKRLKLLSNSELTQRVDSFMKGKYLYESLMKIGFEKWAQHLKKEFCDKTGIIKIEGYAEPTQPKKDISDKELENDTEEFVFEAKNVRNEFVLKAQDDWWLRIGVERVVFEDILIMYDQMIERLSNKASSIPIIDKVEEAIEFAEWTSLTDSPKEEGRFIVRNITDDESKRFCDYGKTFKNKKGVIHWYNIPTELYSKYQWLKTKRYPSDAILFAEWLNKEGYREYDGYDRWIAPHNNNNVYETKNLYKLFKK